MVAPPLKGRRLRSPPLAATSKIFSGVRYLESNAAGIGCAGCSVPKTNFIYSEFGLASQPGNKGGSATRHMSEGRSFRRGP